MKAEVNSKGDHNNPLVLNGEQIFGLFNVDIVTGSKRFLQIIGGICGLAVLVYSIYTIFFNPRQFFGGRVETGAILFLILMIIASVLFSFIGIMSIFSRPSGNFRGLLFSKDCIEKGNLKVELRDLRNAQNQVTTSSRNGKIHSGIWSGEKILDGNSLQLVFVYEFKHIGLKFYCLKKFILFQNDKKFEVSGYVHRYSENTSIALIENGKYNLINNLEINSLSSLDSLNAIFNLINNYNIPVQCMIQFLPETANPVNALPFGLIGGLVKSAMDSSKREDLISQFKNGTSFNSQVSEKFFAFIHDNKWGLIVGDERIV